MENILNLLQCIRHLRSLCLILLFISCIQYNVVAQNNRIRFQCRDYFINGMNVAWADFGKDFAGPSINTAFWNTAFTDMSANGVNCIRVWIHGTKQGDPVFTGSYTVTGPDPDLFNNLDAFFTLAESYDLMVIPVLVDGADIGNNSSGSSHWNFKKMMEDTIKVRTYINNVLTPMVNRYRNRCNILAWDIINEPEYAVERGQMVMKEAKLMVAMCAEAIHRVQPDIMVTVGAKTLQYNSDVWRTPKSESNWWKDASLQAVGVYPGHPLAYLDFYSPHYYNWMNNTGSNEDWSPYKYNAASWGLDKPCIIGETSDDQSGASVWNDAQQLNLSFSNGYAGIMYWSYNQSGINHAGGIPSNWLTYNFFKNELLAFRNAYIPIVDFTCAAGPCCSRPNAGPDKTLCGSGGSVVLNSGLTAQPFRRFNWYNLSSPAVSIGTNPTLTVSSAGTYRVLVDSIDAGMVVRCSQADTVVVLSTLPVPIISPSGPVNLCTPSSLDLTLTNVASFPGGTTWRWSKSGVDISGATGTSLNFIRASGVYRLTASLSGCGAPVFREVTVTSSLPIPNDVCSGTAGTLNLSVTGAGTYQWYDVATGGASLQTGTSYTTPPLPNPTNRLYYVQDAAVVAGAVGPAARIPSGWSMDFPGWDGDRIIFNTGAQPVTINSVTVWADFPSAGTFWVRVRVLRDDATVFYNQPYTVTSAVSGLQSRVINLVTPLIIPASVTGWMMDPDRSNNTPSPRCRLWHADAGAAYPYTSTPAGAITLTGSSNTGRPNAYAVFYNWQITVGSVCSRLPVVAQIGSCGPMPVNFLSFTATSQDDKVILNWATAWEQNNQGFEIERSSDNQNFESIGYIPGTGNTTSSSEYSFADYYPSNGVVYYRLKQKDFDGNYAYSQVITVDANDFRILVYPVPANEGENLNISFTLEQESEVKFSLFDLLGKSLISSSKLCYKGQCNEVVGLGGMKEGIYLLAVTTGNYSITKKISIITK
ncbi:MAG: cellulase family glycosylhydrolase [Cytophagaceae bacterium]|nr:cellulase family glycosylhydrolase [Cytophagaceae bacterium]